MKSTIRQAQALYVLNSALLATHQIDSAYWHEWTLFHLPGDIQSFLIANFVLLWIILHGAGRVIQWAPGARLFAYALAAAGIFAFVIHMMFIAQGDMAFRTPVSVGLLVATLIVSLAQIVVVRRLKECPVPAPARHDSLDGTGHS